MGLSYNEFKNIVIKRYDSPFNPALWVRNKYCDAIVFGIRYDIIYKIITQTDNEYKILEHWQEKSAFSKVVRKIVFVYPENDFKGIKTSKEIDLKKTFYN